MNKVATQALLSAATSTGAGTSFEPAGISRSFQLTGAVSSSTGSATVDVEVSNDGTNFITLGTISLSLTTSTSSDGFVSTTAWRYVRGNVTAISGTGASVTLTMGNTVR